MTHFYEVERRQYHAERPGFRINELQISPTQQVPWHYHSNIQDTFYVLEGSLRIFLQDPKEEVRLARARPIRYRRVARTSSPIRARAPRPSSCCRASVNTTSCRS